MTNLTKVILEKNTELRDEWVNRVPMVSISLSASTNVADTALISN
jgi:hypothetical protein